MNALAALFIDGHWLPMRDGDARGLYLYRRHYSWESSHKRGPDTRFVGPGDRMVLLTADARALFVWRAERHRRDDQTGINCAAFRNEGPVLSSLLIREACDLAWARWPGERLYTYVDSRRIQSRHPGYCFLRAGWDYVRGDDGRPVLTKVNRLHILERRPAASGAQGEE